MGSSVSAEPVIYTSNVLGIWTYEHLAHERPGRNIFFSPLGVSSILTLLAAGSREKTLEQILRALGNNSLKELVSTFERQLKFKQGKDWTTDLYAELFLPLAFKTKKNFRSILGKFDGYYVQHEDLPLNPHEALRYMNIHLMSRSLGQVSDLSFHLDPLPLLVIVSLFHHQTLWKSRFNTDSNTSDFYVDTNRTVPSLYMSYAGTYRHYLDESLRCDVLALPYKDKKTLMLLLVPLERDGLATVEDKMSIQYLENMIPKIKKKDDVRIVLPRFKIRETYTLVPTLKTLEIRDLFDQGRANLSALSKADGELHVDQIVQKATLDFNEHGSKAKRYSGLNKYVVKADHPFLFLICDKVNQMILFMGRLVEPPPM